MKGPRTVRPLSNALRKNSSESGHHFLQGAHFRNEKISFFIYFYLLFAPPTEAGGAAASPAPSAAPSLRAANCEYRWRGQEIRALGVGRVELRAVGVGSPPVF